ncbi:thermonuclease family protein [Mesorhizobium sp. IMUNJ 23033]|uniref:thermonuclease family protein n=1 Tax=Mesorhizobium sp. IMUNJ 23033 TaxID=3378039 RepID=UPI00384F6F4A
MDRSRHDNRSDQWRKRTGAKRSRALRWASVPRRLIFVTFAAAGALAAQIAMQHSDRLPELNASNWFGPKPEPISGVASVIDGDTIEVRGQRIRFNGIDAPESKQYCDDAKGFEYPCVFRFHAYSTENIELFALFVTQFVLLQRRFTIALSSRLLSSPAQTIRSVETDGL